MSYFSRYTTRDYDLSDTPTNTVGPLSRLYGKTFEELRDQCLRNGSLFCDPDFPAIEKSLSTDRRGRYTWKRPKEITRAAKFMADGVSRFDVKQGELGDCWLAAGLVALCDNKSLMDQVIPANQDILGSSQYAGIFRFNFWQYGKWMEVIIDDRLPTIYGGPAFLSSTDDTEFWSALLEKAYAKLRGSYGSLEGGHAIEAMEDFTGGVCEWFDLGNKTPDDLFSIMMKALERHSLLSCAIDTQSSTEMEAELRNGLIKGHAYTVNGVKQLTLTSGRSVSLVRLRNPWGNDKEWKLAWSDRSYEWSSVSEWDKREMQFAKSADGEFWMSYEDFVRNYDKLEICNLGPEELTEDLAAKCHKTWEMTHHESEWIRNVNAGGCLNYWKTSFCSNPQFRIEIECPDDGDNKSTVLVALMQKRQISVKKKSSQNIAIGYSIFKLSDPSRGPLDQDFIRRYGSPEHGSSFTNLREVSKRFKVDPGHYCIVPSTFEPGEEREFIMRIYSEKPNVSSTLDEETQNLDEDSAAESSEDSDDDWSGVISSEDDSEEEKTGAETGGGGAFGSDLSRLHDLLAKADDDDMELLGGDEEAVSIMAESLKRSSDSARQKKRVIAAFGKLSDYGLEMTAFKLREIINLAYTEDFGSDQFSIDACRSMVAMLDNDRSGKLNFQESKLLWKSLRKWTAIFKQYDMDQRGFVRSYQLREVLRNVGYSVSNQTFQTLVQRYGDPDGKLNFQDFVHCVVRLNNMFDVFEESGLGGSIELNLDQFIQTTMYS